MDLGHFLVKYGLTFFRQLFPFFFFVCRVSFFVFCLRGWTLNVPFNKNLFLGSGLWLPQAPHRLVLFFCRRIARPLNMPV